MIELAGFSEYSLNLKENEIYTFKGDEKVKLKRCSDSDSIAWYLYKNGVKYRVTLWRLYIENLDKIESYCKRKTGQK